MVLKTYAITSQTYYDNRLTCYKNILVINNIPVGELTKYVKSPSINCKLHWIFNLCWA